METTKKPKYEPETATAQLLRVAKDTLNRLKDQQEKDEGVCSMPWPEIDNLESAIVRAESEKL